MSGVLWVLAGLICFLVYVFGAIARHGRGPDDNETDIGAPMHGNPPEEKWVDIKPYEKLGDK